MDDRFFDIPITKKVADKAAREFGFRLVDVFPQQVKGETRYLAMYLPIDSDDKRAAILADGRSKQRALRRGIEFCKRLTTGEPYETISLEELEARSDA